MSKEEFKKTERNQVRRMAKRGKYDKDSVYRILDEGSLCHIGFVADGQPFVIPTLFARLDDAIYVHGSQISRMLKTLSQGIELCLSVTLVDGLVLARSAFHHSMNYRSVVIFGRATIIEDKETKVAALFAFSEHVIAGRWAEVREPTQNELTATTVLSLELAEASAKVRGGPPLDDEEDYSLPVWAGVIPLHLAAGEPIKDPRLPADIETPSYTLNYKRGTN